ncbi:MAG: acetate--CoA ligase family protein [Hadesarchaea archaeon]|nr:acetate--CoA ligase family protein [Hadesarchaea archaeon]
MATERKRVAEILASAKKQGRRVLLEHEAKQVLSAWGIPVARSKLARDAAEAVRIARELRYPVVMKIASPDIVHKSDAGGVKVGLSSELEVRQAFDEILANARAYKPNASILGVTVQEYLPQGKEVIIGAMQDPSFGATVMFGLGGIWVEVLKDVSFRLAPLTTEDAKEMIQEIKGYPVLAGLRGEPQADIDAIADMLQKVGDLAYEIPEIAEVDLNPVFAFDRGKGAIAIDARMILGEDG